MIDYIKEYIVDGEYVMAGLGVFIILPVLPFVVFFWLLGKAAEKIIK